MSARCRSCRAPTIWARTEATGTWMPVDAEPAEGGSLVLERRAGQYWAVVAPEAAPPRYTSHFVTCPHADAHRIRSGRLT